MYDIPRNVAITKIRFQALDGYRLGGTLFAPVCGDAHRRAAIFNSGGGIRASRYRHFAAWLAEHGIPVLTFDYRGIGESRPPDIRQLAAGVEEWTEYDVGGAIAKLSHLYPGAEMFGISHSIGALLFGGAPNASAVKNFIFICPHTGFVGDYSWRYRIPMKLMWHYVMPALTRILGYFPGKAIGLGEDLPSGVAMGWAKRKKPDLDSSVADARALTLLRRARELTGDVLVVMVPGDAFATRSGVARLLETYPLLRVAQAPDLQALSGARGHFSFFKPGAETTWWPSILQWMSR